MFIEALGIIFLSLLAYYTHLSALANFLSVFLWFSFCFSVFFSFDIYKSLSNLWRLCTCPHSTACLIYYLSCGATTTAAAAEAEAEAEAMAEAVAVAEAEAEVVAAYRPRSRRTDKIKHTPRKHFNKINMNVSFHFSPSLSLPLCSCFVIAQTSLPPSSQLLLPSCYFYHT